MYKVTRMVRGKPVEYYQSTQRVGGKVKTIYHGPVNPKRRKLDMRGLLAAVAGMGINAAMGRLGPPGGRAHTSSSYDPAHRAKQEANNLLRALYEKHQMSDTNQAAFEADFNRLPKDLQDEVIAARTRAFAGVSAAGSSDTPQAQDARLTRSTAKLARSENALKSTPEFRSGRLENVMRVADSEREFRKANPEAGAARAAKAEQMHLYAQIMHAQYDPSKAALVADLGNRFSAAGEAYKQHTAAVAAKAARSETGRAEAPAPDTAPDTAPAGEGKDGGEGEE